MKFVGENLLPEEYQSLSLDDRAALQWRLKKRSREWLKEQFAKRKSAWIVVVDGQVIAFGKTLSNRSVAPQVRKFCKTTGKFPFIFVNNEFIVIEENPVPGHGAFLNGYSEKDEGLYEK